MTAGAGDYAGATAEILLWGTLDPVTGVGKSHYRGRVTRSQRS